MCTPQWRQLPVVCMHWLRKNSSVCETADLHTPGSKDPAAPPPIPGLVPLAAIVCVCVCVCECVYARRRTRAPWMRLRPCDGACERHLASRTLTTRTLAHVVGCEAGLKPPVRTLATCPATSPIFFDPRVPSVSSSFPSMRDLETSISTFELTHVCLSRHLDQGFSNFSPPLLEQIFS